MDVRNEDRVMIQEHWKRTVVFTDALHIEAWEWGESGKKVPENELLPGELSAVTFSVGCYTVRSAQRVYRICSPVYNPEEETPASWEEMELVRKDITPMGTIRPLVPAWRDELRVTHEISARHNDAPKGKFTYICRAAEASSGRWKEHISAIYSVKESKFIPDEYASLLVCLAFAGDSHGVDIWYKLDPTGKITTLRLHPFDSDAGKADLPDTTKIRHRMGKIAEILKEIFPSTEMAAYLARCPFGDDIECHRYYIIDDAPPDQVKELSGPGLRFLDRLKEHICQNGEIGGIFIFGKQQK